ncbi:hypothetical protein fugu_015195 [Takifugu bimaculatus]|uniref:RNA helicase n=1 Tax=Takifugu bimaculatus TaxID=433685 RepID=A0A4Z2BY34_9TELE|nr:hypothetical protein fugu_015195 [Takifugu bimaculatus]
MCSFILGDSPTERPERQCTECPDNLFSTPSCPSDVSGSSFQQALGASRSNDDTPGETLRALMTSESATENTGGFSAITNRQVLLVHDQSAMNWNKGGPGVKRGFGFGGFSLAGKKEEPQPPQSSHTSFVPPGQSGKNQQLPSFYKIGSKRANFDEENAYFEDDEEESSSNVDLPYIPAENSPTRQQMKAGGGSDSEDDPLDAFMAEVENQAAKDMRKLEEKEKKSAKGIRDDIEEEDEQEAYFRYMAENPTAGLTLEEEEDNIDYDSDGNPIPSTTKKIILPLPPIDHSEIDYPPFEKNFYNEHEELSSLNGTQVIELRQKLNLRVSGAAPPKPSTSFAHFGFDEQLMHQIRKSEYTQPTPIQCQGVPIALSGRDMIGIAKTGSGKTAAFIWPMLVHIMDQKELEAGEGPIAVIVCPHQGALSANPRGVQALWKSLLAAVCGCVRRRQHVGAGQSSAGGSRDCGVHPGPPDRPR